MTSGIFHSVELSSITIPPNRQRQTLPSHMEALQDSIRRLGLIQPIVISQDHELVAGYCRLTAVRLLGWTHIAAQYQNEIDEFTRYCIELEENTKREDLHWADYNDSIARYHELRGQHDKKWTLEKTAAALGMTKANVSKHVSVAADRKTEPSVANATSFGTAVNTSQRLRERRRADEVALCNDTHSQIAIDNFNTWAPVYSGPKFNLIHCDFPYGINAHQSAGQNSSLDVNYTDTPETYWQLFKTLSIHLDRFCAESAHMIFWFSPNVYCATWEMLKLLDGFRFDEHPLIWQRGENEGIAPDPARRPRRVYEMAFFGWRGDRKIIRTKSNSIVAPTERDRHPHEKSEAALRHFFEMCVDGNTAIFDPTCGSGSALRAARHLGASRWLGLELNEEYASVARRALQG